MAVRLANAAGAPAGAGSTRNPRRDRAPGDWIESGIDAIGTLRNRCTAGA